MNNVHTPAVVGATAANEATAAINAALALNTAAAGITLPIPPFPVPPTFHPFPFHLIPFPLVLPDPNIMNTGYAAAVAGHMAGKNSIFLDAVESQDFVLSVT